MTSGTVYNLAMAWTRRKSPTAGVFVREPLCLSVAALVWALTVTSWAQPHGSGGVNRPEHLAKPYVVLVSLDGFKPEYLDRFHLPNLGRVMARGVRARAMVPVFPTLTFPNHYSLVTGLRPARHGIVSNNFWDPERARKYSMSDGTGVTDGTWYGGEPIWVTAETQGMVAACFFWPGSEAAIKAVRPTFTTPYDGKVPNGERVKTVIDWLRMPRERRPHLITLYFSDVDTATHRGPLDSPDVEKAVRSVDVAIGALLDGVDALPIRNRVNLLITSDHGMVDTTQAQSVALESVLLPHGMSEITQSFGGPVASLHLRSGILRAAAIRDEINATLQHGRAYRRGELPERFHYRGNPRAGDVVVVMDESWTLRTPGQRQGSLERWGQHGWDNGLPSMRATFLAVGPGIRRGARIGDVRNIDVYSLMTELLGLRAARGIDGRPGRIKAMISRQER